jgi:hypothetical protein
MAHWVAAGATAAVLSVVSGTADWPTACNLQQEEQLPIRTTCNRFLHCLCCSTTTNCCAVSIYFLFVLTKLYLFLGYDKTESLLPAKTKKTAYAHIVVVVVHAYQRREARLDFTFLFFYLAFDSPYSMGLFLSDRVLDIDTLHPLM